MIEINIPGRGLYELEHLVLDVNGTLAIDGVLIEGVARALRALSDRFQIHLVTADTHGRQQWIDQSLGLQAFRLQPGDEAGQKTAFVERLGAKRVVAIGQGANDAGMLKAAAIGICVLSKEGTASEALLASDILVLDILNALELLERPLRLVATLRQ